MIPAARAAGVAATAFALTAAAIPALSRMAVRRGWLDRVGKDPLKIHAAPIPFTGGLAIGLGLVAGLLVAWPTLSGGAGGVGLVIGLSACVAMLGFADDRTGVRPLVRLEVEILLASALVLMGAELGLFNPRRVAPLELGGLGIALMALFFFVYIVGAINAINMFDGLDGLAGGTVLITCIGVGMVAAHQGHALALGLALALGGALAAFLIFNFAPASVFMGDSGSYLLGFLVATMALLVTFKRGTFEAVLGGGLMVGLPVVDAAVAVARRLRRGVSPFKGDRSHLYDLLRQRGLSVRAVVLLCWTLQGGLVAAGALLIQR